nr:NAD(P)/FAD-dependent oxidoreductase [Deinobacterium chartae]
MVIGAGPAGLHAAFYCGMRGLSVRVLDALPRTGGQLTALYPEKPIFDVAGLPQVQASRLVAELEEQLRPFSPLYALGERVLHLEGSEGAFVAVSATGRRYAARAVIVASGMGALEARRPQVPGAELFANHILTHLEAPAQLAGRRVLVFGGGEEAACTALALRGVAASVTLLHRRPHLTLSPATRAALQAATAAGELALRVPAELVALEGEERLERIRVLDTRSRLEESLAVDTLISKFSYVSRLDPAGSWGLAVEGGSLRVDARQETSRPGVFAVGDCAATGGLKLISVGFAQAATAANVIASRLTGGRVAPGHSSERDPAFRQA